MNSDFIVFALKGALDKGVKDGARAFIEDIANKLNEEQLEKLSAILTAVLAKKKEARTVEVRVIK